MRIDLEALWLASGKTVLFVTHSIDEAVLLADRVIVMSPRPGRVDRIVDVDLARPRGLSARKQPAFQAASDAIVAMFLERGVLRGAATLRPHEESPYDHRRPVPWDRCRSISADASRSFDRSETLRGYIDGIAAADPSAIAMNMDASEGPALDREEQLEVLRICRNRSKAGVPSSRV